MVEVVVVVIVGRVCFGLSGFVSAGWIVWLVSLYCCLFFIVVGVYHMDLYRCMVEFGLGLTLFY